MENQSFRAFFAIPVPQETKSHIRELRNKLEQAFPKAVRWVRPDQIHITLKFFPEFQSKHIHSIQMELEREINKKEQFDVSIHSCGVFPNQKSPRVIWLGIKNQESIIQINQDIEKISSRHGYSKEKRTYSPHLTIGRIKNGLHGGIRQKFTKYIKEQMNFQEHIFVADHFSLIKSRLTPEGPIYSELFRINLFG